MTALEAIQHVHDLTDRFTVQGSAIEQMAALRAAIREAYAAVKQELAKQDAEEDDGK